MGPVRLLRCAAGHQHTTARSLHVPRLLLWTTAPGDGLLLAHREFHLPHHRRRPFCDNEQRWRAYAMSLLAFSLVSVLFSYVLLRTQSKLPLNPDHMAGVGPSLSFNTAVSFLTNTNWQTYAGESTMSHLSQMLALVLHQYMSAAMGMAVAIAFTRAIIRRRSNTLGNFWVDLIRSTTRILLPISLLFACGVHVPGRDPELPSLAHGQHHVPRRASTATARPSPPKLDPWRTSGEHGTDRGSRRQRWRLLQRQHRPPLSGTERPARPAGHVARHPVALRLPVHLRQSGRLDAPRLGRARLDGDPVRGGEHLHLRRRGPRQPEVQRRGGQSDSQFDQRRRQHGGQGDTARHRRLDPQRERRHCHVSRGAGVSSRELHPTGPVPSHSST